MNKLLLIIPAFNEEENIERVVENICKNYPQFDYVVDWRAHSRPG